MEKKAKAEGSEGKCVRSGRTLQEPVKKASCIMRPR